MMIQKPQYDITGGVVILTLKKNPNDENFCFLGMKYKNQPR